MKRSVIAGLGVAAVLLVAGMAQAAVTVTVAELLPYSATPGAGIWYQTDVRTGGTASIVELGATGVVKLTTDMTNAAKAEVGMFSDFGLASTTLNNIVLGYSFYKQTVTGGNAFAAPSIKLQISAAGGTGDNYGNLVYEPTWNIGAGSQPVWTDAWQNVSITSDTGVGADQQGGWWWNGGFEISSGSGGPPIRSLSEWVAAFQAADPTDFANARVVGLSVGVGTYNQGQIDYFDNVSIKSGDVDAVYDFEFAASSTGGTVPEPGTLAIWSLLGLTAAGFGYRRRRRVA